MSTNQKNSIVNRAEKRQEERRIKKMQNRTYSFKEVDHILKTQIVKHSDILEAQTAVLLANILEKEPYDFSRQGVCDVVAELKSLRTKLNSGEINHGEILKVAQKHGVTIDKNESSVHVKLDRGDDTNGGNNDK